MYNKPNICTLLNKNKNTVINMEDFLRRFFFDGKVQNKVTLLGRVVVAISFLVLITMLIASYNDDKTFNALLWFVLPLWTWTALLFTLDIKTSAFVLTHTIVIILWWLVIAGHIIYIIIHDSASYFQTFLWANLFLIFTGAFSTVITMVERKKA